MTKPSWSEPALKLVSWYPRGSQVVSRLVLNYAQCILWALFIIPIEQVLLFFETHLFSNTIDLIGEHNKASQRIFFRLRKQI